MKRRLKKASIGVLCFAWLLSVVACNSQTKNLTERSARTLIQGGIAKNADHFRVPIRFVDALIKDETLEDFKNGQYAETDNRAPLQRLIKAGYISGIPNDVAYPNLAGSYKCDLPISPTRPARAAYTLELVTHPGSLEVSGQYTFQDWELLGCAGAGCRPSGAERPRQSGRGPIQGHYVAPDVVELAYGMTNGFTKATYKIVASGRSLQLNGRDVYDQGDMTLVGTGPGGSITVPWYRYAYNGGTDLGKMWDDPERNFVKGGTFEVDDVENLLLQTDTIARAEFTWHTVLSTVAATIVGHKNVHGTGSAAFGKKPDGTWVLQNYEMGAVRFTD